MTRAIVRSRMAVLIGAGVIALACDLPGGSGRELPRPPLVAPAPTPPSNGASQLAGAYTVAIDLAEGCAAFPDEAKRRVYEVTVATTSSGYLSIRSGGTSKGSLWPTENSRVRVDWNNFDIGGCDGWPEPLSGGRSLMICGDGLLAVEGSTISGGAEGRAFIQEGTMISSACSGAHRFTFTRTSQ